MMKYLIALVFVLTGCTTTPRAPFDYNEVKRVGVISIMGDKAEYQRLGMTRFGNASGSFSIADADLDALYQKSVEEALTAMERYEVIHLDYDPAELIAREQAKVKRSFADVLWQGSHWKLADQLQEMASAHQLDAILVLSPVHANTGLSVAPRGASVYYGGLPGNVMWCRVGAYSILSLINGKDGFLVRGQVVARETSFFEISNNPLAGAPAVTRRSDAGSCEIQGAGPSPAQIEDFIGTFQSVLTPAHLSHTLDKLMRKAESHRLNRR